MENVSLCWCEQVKPDANQPVWRARSFCDSLVAHPVSRWTSGARHWTYRRELLTSPALESRSACRSPLSARTSLAGHPSVEPTRGRTLGTWLVASEVATCLNQNHGILKPPAFGVSYLKSCKAGKSPKKQHMILEQHNVVHVILTQKKRDITVLTTKPRATPPSAPITLNLPRLQATWSECCHGDWHPTPHPFALQGWSSAASLELQLSFCRVRKRTIVGKNPSHRVGVAFYDVLRVAG